MTDAIWDTIIRAGVTPTVMAVFCYFTYKYLTSQSSAKDERIAEKDQIILQQHRQILDMTKLFIETQNNQAREISDVLKIAIDMEAKIDTLANSIRDIKSFIPK